jgi:hypothetical protein
LTAGRAFACLRGFGFRGAFTLRVAAHAMARPSCGAGGLTAALPRRGWRRTSSS